MGKMMSLCDNVTNLYMPNVECSTTKKHDSILVISALFSPESTI